MLPSQIKAIIFDLDGVLLDNAGIYFEAAGKALQLISGHKEQQRSLLEEIVRRLENGEQDLAPHISSSEFPNFIREYGSAWTSLCLDESRVRNGVPSLIKNLRDEGYKLGIVTGRWMSRGDTTNQLKSLGIVDLFDTLVTREDVGGISKPFPDQLLLAAQRLGVTPGECASVGDMPLDMRASRNAKMFSIAVCTGVYPDESLEREKPDLVLTCAEDLIQLDEKKITRTT